MREVAERATFQSFANCYLREVDPGVPSAHQPECGGALVDYIEWSCAAAAASLRAEVERHSLCGPLRFGRVFVRRAQENDWREIAPLRALYLMVQECYAGMGAERADALRHEEAGLLGRVLTSYHGMADGLEAAAGCGGLNFIDCEQSLIFGHWLHPTPKSLQGITDWQRPTYAPEHRGRFPLVFFAADAALIRQDAAPGCSLPEILEALIAPDQRPRLRPGEVLIPMHPLQAEALMLDPAIAELTATGRLRCLGPIGTCFSPTSSVRTLYSADVPWMLKFSLPVRITNSLRVNRMSELEAGVAVSRLFARTDILARHPRFRLIRDPAYVTLALPDRTESGFEVIFRENPFTRGFENNGVTIAALTADPPPGTHSRLERIIRGLAARSGDSIVEAGRRWFAAYLDCALDPLVRIYDELGVAFEAHQQNGLLDVSAGLPSAFYYRDNQGFYLSNAHRDRLTALAPETARIGGLYFDDCLIQERFGYYLIVNQVCSVIARMGQDELVAEEALLAVLRERLERLATELNGVGGEFAASFLSRPTVAAKANLLTRMLDIDELEGEDGRAIYVQLPNPLFTGRRAARRGGIRAAAV
ncbi:rhizobactin siderophore biosynthesis protein rhbC [Rhodopseudomonas sp. HC1]|uniref:IucA/IucC family protein n=1 Tax=Rhodopseudomonas infernalis TaxID=2897386 RepID=UPI001EE876D1|nr:IucA/IucC family protein [Rhodopseudomonas infernalis]MCG6203411.1 rhizobactin siderophore biosynthesis protein rhbC [Rhodopseudomonas infernalis]